MHVNHIFVGAAVQVNFNFRPASPLFIDASFVLGHFRRATPPPPVVFDHLAYARRPPRACRVRDRAGEAARVGRDGAGPACQRAAQGEGTRASRWGTASSRPPAAAFNQLLRTVTAAVWRRRWLVSKDKAEVGKTEGGRGGGDRGRGVRRRGGQGRWGRGRGGGGGRGGRGRGGRWPGGAEVGGVEAIERVRRDQWRTTVIAAWRKRWHVSKECGM